MSAWTRDDVYRVATDAALAIVDQERAAVELVVDEAYIDFAEPGRSAVRFVHAFPNLIVLRTMSKSYSLCGIRFGYAFAQKPLIETLDK